MAQISQITVLIKGEDQLSKPATAATKALASFNQTALAADKAAGSATGAVSRMAASFGKFAGVGAGLAIANAGIGALTKGAGGLGKALIGSNITMENTRAQLVAMTKDGAKADQILADIREEADKTPFAFEEMAKATASLMPAAKASGTALMDLVKQAEILAAANPAQGLEGAAFALREALSGDFASVIERFDLPRQRLNELKAQGVPAVKAIGQAMREMGLDADLVAKRAETLEGRWSTFQDTLAGIGRVIGEPLFAQIKRALEAVQTFLDQNKATIQAWATTVGNAIGSVATTVVDVFTGKTSIPQLLADGLVKGKSIAGDLTAWLGKQWAAVDWGAVWKQVTGFASGLMTGLGNVATDVGAYLGGQWAAVDWAGVWKQVKGHGEALLRALAPISSDLTTWMVDQWRLIDWDAVMSRARVGSEATAAVVRSFTGLTVVPIAEAVGTWFGTGLRAGVDKVLASATPFGTAPADLLAALRKLFLEVAPQLPGMFARVITDGLWAGWTAAIRAFLGRDPGALLRSAVQSAVGGVLPGALGGAAGQVTPGRGSGTGSTPAFQHGGSFVVGGQGGPDSQMVAFRATPGERVTVQTPQQAGAPTISVNGPLIHVAQVSGEADVDLMMQKLEVYLSDGLRAARASGQRFPLGLAPGAV